MKQYRVTMKYLSFDEEGRRFEDLHGRSAPLSKADAKAYLKKFFGLVKKAGHDKVIPRKGKKNQWWLRDKKTKTAHTLMTLERVR